MEATMRRTRTDKLLDQRARRIVPLAASILALAATFSGSAVLADGKSHRHHHYGHSYYDEERYRQGPIYWKQQKVRVRIPVREQGPETLPLGRLIARNSNVDLDRYQLVAVVTRNGRFSNGYASLRTGHSKTQRYFLGSREQTWIPAPSGASSKWRLRLGPGTQVRSVTAILEPRRGWGIGKPAHRRHASIYHRDHHAADSAPWLGLGWMFADAERQHRKQANRLQQLRAEHARTEAELAQTRRKLERSREHNRRLKDQRARLADELVQQQAEERMEERQGKRGKAEGKGPRNAEREARRTVRYVVSAS